MCRKNSDLIHVIFSPSLWLLCTSLEAYNWAVAGHHLNASHPMLSVWPNPNISTFSGIYFWKTLNCQITSTVRAFNLVPNLRAKPEYQLSSGSKCINVILCDSHRHCLHIDTTQNFLDNPSGQLSIAIKYKFMTWIWSLFCLHMSSHIHNWLFNVPHYL